MTPKQLRAALNMTQPEMANMMGVAERTVRNAEAGHAISASLRFSYKLIEIMHRHCPKLLEKLKG